MLTIKNDSDLRIAYNIMRVLEEDGCSAVADYKRNIRAYYKQHNSDRRIVKDYGIDGYVVLIELPEWIESESDATEYFKEYEYIKPYYTYYDCTGTPFTSWYKVFERRGRWMAYHSVGFDV